MQQHSSVVERRRWQWLRLYIVM